MSLKLEIPDGHVESLKVYYNNIFENYKEKVLPLINEWDEISPILLQLGVIKNTTNTFYEIIKGDSKRVEEPKQVGLNGYNKEWSWKDKSIYVIENNGALTPKGIVNILVDNYEQGLSKDLAINSVPATLSVAAKEGKYFSRFKNDKGEYVYDIIK